jgi:hypothetical protein
MTDGQAETREIRTFAHPGAFAADDVSAFDPAAEARRTWHVRHRVTPRMSHIWQMNVPQSTHG